jgi:hypothetical protein
MMKICAQNAKFLSARMYGTYSYHWSLKCEKNCHLSASVVLEAPAEEKGNNIPSFIKFPLISNTFINNRNIV